MSLLVDADIVASLASAAPLVLGLKKPADWGAADSPIQPASVDLHVGDIFIPSTSDAPIAKPVGEEWILKPGNTALVVTAETLDLPGTVGAFGFPPTSVSGGAVLMTNPGHADPGFKGPMRFTLINMGRKDFTIRRGDTVVTMLFVRTTRAPDADYAKRQSVGRVGHTTIDVLNRLGKDFLEFRTEATRIARKEVSSAQIKVPIITALITAAVTFAGIFLSLRSGLEDTKKDVAVLSARVEARSLSAEVDSLKARVDSLLARR